MVATIVTQPVRVVCFLRYTGTRQSDIVFSGDTGMRGVDLGGASPLARVEVPVKYSQISCVQDKTEKCAFTIRCCVTCRCRIGGCRRASSTTVGSGWVFCKV
jgi:hypothetical protein